MRRALQTRAFDRVRSVLEPGEEPVVAARAMVGPFSSSRFAAVATATANVEIAGVLGAAVGKQFIVVTNRRLIFLPQSTLGGPGTKILGTVPRGAVSLAEVTIGIVSLLRVSFGYLGEGMALTFPRQDQRNAKELAAELARVPAA